MDGGRNRTTAPIPIRPKDPSYMDMGSGCQPLPTVKESGSKNFDVFCEILGCEPKSNFKGF